MMSDRFLLFGGDTYYPLGGWADFKGSFPNVKQAVAEAARWGWGWYQVVDLSSGEMIDEQPKRS